MTVRYSDHEEIVQAGEAFYMPPGHVPAATAGTEFLQFSPTDQIQAVEAHVAKRLQELHQVQGT